jgi:hypothetical protein
VAGDAAQPAARPAALTDRSLLPSPLAQRRDMGAHTYGVARADSTAAGTRGDVQRSHPGQSNGQDESKGGLRGYDAHKQVKGRKRHLLVDTQGLVLKVVVSAATVQDRDGARLLAQALRFYGPPLPRVDPATRPTFPWSERSTRCSPMIYSPSSVCVQSLDYDLSTLCSV